MGIPCYLIRRRGGPPWRGPPKIWDVDETGATVKFQGQYFKVAGYCARKRMVEKDACEAEWNRASGTRNLWDGTRLEVSEEAQKFTVMPSEADGGANGPTEDLLRESYGMQTLGSPPVSPRWIPGPDSPKPLVSFPTHHHFLCSFQDYNYSDTNNAFYSLHSCQAEPKLQPS